MYLICVSSKLCEFILAKSARKGGGVYPQICKVVKSKKSILQRRAQTCLARKQPYNYATYGQILQKKIYSIAVIITNHHHEYVNQ